ncbi:filamentous hemagglutinin N-terminal domain-containing protein [Microbulbifer aggregans]|uniref:filamentous hemagglutinin N-terminal domain-containing protein n=1 Tax=Microbulbifer aggregans TaxID=1769779 RepID=UPI001CFDA93A|nr:filamentous hemagglutinin N-terminal domain-containing protein [Microbulbifer aggregans]
MKANMSYRKKPISAAIKLAHMACFGSFVSIASVAQAGPGNHQVVIGSADVSKDGDATNISIENDFARIEWESFDLVEGESANFYFGDLSSDELGLVINDIGGGQASNIAGQINSTNGHVVLINPKGVIFSSGSVVNVAALTVSTLSGEISTRNDQGVVFEADAGGLAGLIENSGQITATSGNVTLIGQSVRNAEGGNIEAALGEIRMLAGNSAALHFDKGGLIGVEVTSEFVTEAFGEEGAVFNAGNLEAASVILEASVAEDLFANAVNNSGDIKATGIEQVGGTIRLTGNVSGASTDGSVTTGVLNTGSLNASGAIAGSVDLSGGDIVQSGQISADAEALGNGGTVTIQAANKLSLSGSISARGAGAGNSGGAVITAAGEIFQYTDDTADGEAVVVTRSDSGAASGSWTLESNRIEVGNCVENCLGGSDLANALEDNATVSLVAHGIPADEQDTSSGTIVVNDAVQWNADSTLQLESSTSISVASTGAGTVTIDGGSGALEATSSLGFHNDGAINVDDFALTVGNGGNGSTSKLGAVTATNPISVTAGSGSDQIDLAGFTDNSTLRVDSVGDGLAISVDTQGSEVATLSGFESMSMEASDTLSVGALSAEVAIAGSNQVAVSANSASISFDGVAQVSGDSTNRVTGGNDWALLSGTGASNSDIAFSGGLNIETGSGSLVGTTSVDTFNLLGANTLEAGGLTFTGLSSVDGGSGDDILNAQSSGTSFALNDGNTISAASMEFSGVTVVNGGTGSDNLDASSLATSLFFTTSDGRGLATESTGGIRFVGMDSVVASNLDLTLVDASVTINGSKALQSGSGASSVSFTGIDNVEGNVGDVVAATSGSEWILANGGGASNSDIAFSGGLSIETGSGSLVGTASVDTFNLLGANTLEAGGLAFTGLSSVDGGSGDDILNAQSSGTSFALNDGNTISAASMEFSGVTVVNGGTGSDNLDASSLATSLFFTTSDGRGLATESTGGIRFVGMDSVVASNLDLTLVDASVTINGSKALQSGSGASSVSFTEIDNVEGDSGDVVTATSDWSLGNGGGATNSSINFSGSLLVSASGANLQGTNRSDTFTLNEDGSLGAGGLVFADLGSVVGGSQQGGADVLSASSYAEGVTLGSQNNTVGAAGIAFSGIEEVSVSQLNAHANGSEFSLDGGVLSANSIDFTDVSRVNGGATSRVASNSGDWTLISGGGASNSSIDFFGALNIEAIGATLIGTSGVDEFVLSGTNQVQAGGLTFSSLEFVDAGEGVDTLEASTTADATLGAEALVLNAGGVEFSNIDEVTTGALTAHSAGSNFVLNNDDSVTANGIDFSSVAQVNGASGNDSLNALSLGNDFLYLLTANGREVGTQASGGIVFSEMDSVTASNLDFTQVNVNLEVTASNSITARNPITSGSADFDGVEQARGDADNTVIGLNNWTLLNDGGASNSNIDFFGELNVLAGSAILIGTSGADEFVLSGANEVKAGGLTFSSLTAVDAGDGADKLDALAANTTLGAADFSLSTGGVQFSNIEEVTTQTLTANSGGSSFELNSDNSIGANQITFSGVNAVEGAAGNDSLSAQNLGDQFLYVNQENGLEVGSGSDTIVFNNMDSVTASNLDFSAVDLELTVSANNTITTDSATFGGVEQARGDADNTVIGLNNWTLLNDGGASNGNIDFFGELNVLAGSAILIGTSGADEFVLSGANEVKAGGLTFSSLTAVDAGDGADKLDALAANTTLGAADFSLSTGGVQFSNIEEVTTQTLTANSGGSSFELNSDNSIGANQITFSGVNAVEGAAGNDSLSAQNLGDQFLYVNQENGLEVGSGSDTIVFNNMDSVTASNLDFSAVDLELTVSANNTITTDSATFGGVEQARGDADNTVIGLNNWTLLNDGGASNGNIDFFGELNVLAGSAILIGTSGADEFVLSGANEVKAGGLTFSSLTAVDAGDGADKLDASAADNTTLGAADFALSTGGVQFSNIDEVTTGTLAANSAGSNFILNSDSSVTANNIDFSGVSLVSGSTAADSVSGGSSWERSSDAFINSDGGSSITFSGIESFATSNGSLTDNQGGDTYKLAADNSVTLGSTVFTGLSDLIANGEGNLDASGYAEGLTLNGTDKSLDASGLTFSGLSTVTVPKLTGSTSADHFVVIGSGIVDVKSMTITGVSDIEAGSTANIAEGQSGVDWLLNSSGGAENSDITFSGFNRLEAVNGGLQGTEGDDVFVLSSGQGGSPRVSVSGMTFENLSHLNAGGHSSGDKLSALGFGDIALTGSDNELQAASLLIRDIESADIENLVGSSGSDAFTVIDENLISVAGMEIGSLLSVNGGDGEDAIFASGFTASDLNGGNAEVAGIRFSGIDRFSGGMVSGRDKDNDIVVVNDDGTLTYGSTTLVDILGFDGKSGDDTVVGADGQSWTIIDGLTATSSGLTFLNFEYILVSNAGVYGTASADNFVLGADSSVKLGDMSFSGMSFVDGLEGENTLDASAFSGGLALSDISGELFAGDLKILGIKRAIAGLVIGTANDDEFNLSENRVLSVGDFDFSGVNEVQGGGGSDRLVSQFDDSWTLSGSSGDFEHADVDFSEIATVSGENGQIIGDTSGHQFSVAGDNSVRVGTTLFSGITAVDANGQDDGVTATAEVALSGTGGAFNTGGIDFTGIDRATAESVVGSDSAETFSMSGSGAFSVLGIEFSGVSKVFGGAGSGSDAVVSRAGLGYALDASHSVFHDGITFSGIEAYTGANAGLSVTGQASARVTGNGSVASGLSTFSGVESMVFEDQVTQLEAWDGVTVNGTGTVTSGGIAVTGVTSVSNTGVLTATSGDDEFIVTGSNALTLAEMDFEAVSSVSAGVGKDSVQGLVSSDWQLGAANGALEHAGMAFTGMEVATGGSGVVRGSNADTLFTLSAAGDLNAKGIRLESVNSVVAGSGADTVSTVSGSEWVLGNSSGSATSQGVDFSGIEQVSTASARVDASANNGAETFSLATDAAEVSVLGLLFKDVAEVTAGSENGDEVVSGAKNWQLVGSSGQVEANGVTFAGINRVTVDNANLSGTSADENFALTGTSGGLTASGIQFAGISKVAGNGGTDSLTATAAGEEFALAKDGTVAVAGIDFTGVSRVDSAGGEDVVRGDAAEWASVVSGSALESGTAMAELESISVLFENLERVENTGLYSGASLDTEYFLLGQNSIQVGGVTFDGLQTLTAGAGSDTLHGIDADQSWTLGSAGGSLVGADGTLNFSGFENIVAGSGADAFTLEGGTLASLDTGAGNDSVVLRGTLLDQLFLGSGNDELTVLSGSQPAVLNGGGGDDRLQMSLAGQTWRVNGGKSAVNLAGEYQFTGFESLEDSSGGLHLVTNQQLELSVSDTGAAVSFAVAGMTLSYDPSGDVVLDSQNTATVTGTLGARDADLTLAGDLDINTEVDSLSVHSSGGNIDIAVVAQEDLEIGQIDAGDGGSVSLQSAGVGVLTAAAFSGRGRDNQHIIAGNITLGSDERSWRDVGSADIPLGLYVTGSAELYALSYYDPFVTGGGEFEGFGNRLESVAGAQSAQGLRSTVQSPADDIAQLDPAIFTEVSPYSLSVEALNSPELQLHAGELVPLDEREKKRRKDAAVANGGK